MNCNCDLLYKCSACNECYVHTHQLEDRDMDIYWWRCKDGYSHPAYPDLGQFVNKPTPEEIEAMYKDNKLMWRQK